MQLRYPEKTKPGPMTRKQGIYIRNLGGGDVRGQGLNYDQASALIERLKAEKEARLAAYESAYEAAHIAGHEAATNLETSTMIVVEPSNPLDDSSPPKKVWACNEGPCGFAWVNVRPGNSKFANWLKKNHDASRSYYGGLDIWVGAYGQSYERKKAYAHAFADVLARELDDPKLRIYPMSRLD